MKREKRLTKRERKALEPRRQTQPQGEPQHIHCVACGRHIDPAEFSPPQAAKVIRCQHGSQFATCLECEPKAVALLAEHDRTGRPVQAAGAWH